MKLNRKLYVAILQGVPINMEVQLRLLYHLQSMRNFFMNTIIAVFQFKHLKSKTLWSTTFIFEKFTEICTNSIYLINLIKDLTSLLEFVIPLVIIEINGANFAPIFF